MKQILRFTACFLWAAAVSLAAGCSDDEPNDNPPGGGDPISVAAKYALGARTESAAGESYRIVLSALELKGTAEAPKLSAAGQFLTIVLIANEQEPNTLPAGTYTLVDQPTAGQGDLSACRLETTDAQGNAGSASQVMLSGQVRVTHAANGYKIEVTGQLAGQRALSYSYEGAIAFGSEDPTPLYDVEINARYGLGVDYPQVMEDGSSNFFMTLSDVEIEGDAEVPIFAGAAKYVQLDLYAIETEPLILPEGTYQFTEEMPSDKTGSIEYSGFNTTDQTGEPASDLTLFSELTMTVTHTDDGYKIDATGRLADGRTFHIAFEGLIDFVDAGGGGGDIELPGLAGNVQTTFILADVAYRGVTSEGTAHYELDFYDNDIDQDFKTTNRLTLDLFTAASQTPLDGIAVGTYTVVPTLAAGTIMPGELNLESFQIGGSYCEQTAVVGEEFELLYGLLQQGTVTIAVAGGQYTVTADVTDADGYTIRGTYAGEIVVEDKSVSSTLTGDKEVDLTGKICELDYWGDDYQVGGNNWLLFIYTPQEVTDGIIPADGSEAFQIELISQTGSFADGLPAGDYIVGALDDYTPGSNICLPGVMSGSDLYSSWYLGEFESNAAYAYAPFRHGSVRVARSGNQYTITIDMFDDAKPANNVTATWTGTPEVTNQTGPSALRQRAAKQVRKAVVAPGATLSGRTVDPAAFAKKAPNYTHWQ